MGFTLSKHMPNDDQQLTSDSNNRFIRVLAAFLELLIEAKNLDFQTMVSCNPAKPVNNPLGRSKFFCP